MNMAFFTGSLFKKIYYTVLTVALLLFFYVGFTRGFYAWYQWFNDLLINLLFVGSFKATVAQENGHYVEMFSLVRFVVVMIAIFFLGALKLRIGMPGLVRRIFWKEECCQDKASA